MDLFATQYSFGRLGPTILAIVLAVFLLLRRESPHKGRKLLAVYFIFVVLFNAGYLVGYSLYGPAGAAGWYVAALAPFGLVVLIQFAYRFPAVNFPREARFFLIGGLILSVFASGDYYYTALKAPVESTGLLYGSVYGSPYIPVLALVFFLWACFVFLRQCYVIEKKGEGYTSGFWPRIVLPSTREGRAARNFAVLVVLDMLLVALVISFMNFQLISLTAFTSVMNAVLLLIYSFYILVYLNSGPEPVPFIFKFSGGTLVLLLCVVGFLGQMTLYYFDREYDEGARRELKYAQCLLETDRGGSMAGRVSFIYSLNRDRYFYENSGFSGAGAESYLWEWTPSIFDIEGKKGTVAPKKTETGVRYFARVGNKNYILYREGEFLGGFNIFDYREYIHRFTWKLMVSLIVMSLMIVITAPFLVLVGLVNPLKEVFDRYGDGEKGRGGEIRALAMTVDSVAEAVRRGRELSVELSGLKERLKARQELNITDEVETKLGRVMEYIQDNYREDISREGLASMVEIDPSYLGKTFKRHTGKKLSDYINELRIEESLVLLEKSEKTVIDISFHVGFESLRTFNRIFVKYTGITPTEYRKNLRR